MDVYKGQGGKAFHSHGCTGIMVQSSHDASWAFTLTTGDI